MGKITKSNLITTEAALRDAAKAAFAGGSTMPSGIFSVFPLMEKENVKIGNKKMISYRIAVVSEKGIAFMAKSNFFKSGRNDQDESVQVMDLGFDGWNASHTIQEILDVLKGKVITVTGEVKELRIPTLFPGNKPDWEHGVVKKKFAIRETEEDAEQYAEFKKIFIAEVGDDEEIKKAVLLLDPHFFD